MSDTSPRDTWLTLPPRTRKGFPPGAGKAAVLAAEDVAPYPHTVPGTRGLERAIRQWAQRNGHHITTSRRNNTITVTHLGKAPR